MQDSRASSLPAWLASTFADKHAQAAIHTDTNMADGFEIYYAEFDAGQVCMGGNGNTGAGSNYIVVVGPQGAQEVLGFSGYCSDGAAGPEAGTPCKFPFVYNGKVYTGCTTADWTQQWCSTDSEYSGNWGNCVGCNEANMAKCSFEYFDTAIPVSGAEDACLQLGGFLASIHSDAEQVGLTTLQFTSNCVLIDL